MKELDNNTFTDAIGAASPAVVDFWAGWCMPCKIFSPVLDDVSSELDGKADFYKVNIDDFPEIAAKYDIVSIPTVIVFKNGEPLERMVGVRQREEVVETVSRHI